MKQTTLFLPWPPTVNTYWRNITIKGKPRVLISKKGREYRKIVQAICQGEMPHKYGDDKIDVMIGAYPPDNRRRDLDNLPKAVLDALQKAGIYSDDSNIDALGIIRFHVQKPGGIVVQIKPMDQP